MFFLLRLSCEACQGSQLLQLSLELADELPSLLLAMITSIACEW